MYIHMYTMAKTIMVSNDVYKELSMVKNNRSFSELFHDLLHASKLKKGSGLRECLGLLKEDKEWKEIKKGLDKGWKKWTEEYA